MVRPTSTYKPVHISIHGVTFPTDLVAYKSGAVDLYLGPLAWFSLVYPSILSTAPALSPMLFWTALPPLSSPGMGFWTFATMAALVPAFLALVFALVAALSIFPSKSKQLKVCLYDTLVRCT